MLVSFSPQQICSSADVSLNLNNKGVDLLDDLHFSTQNGETFSWETWVPSSGKVRAVIIAIHGMGTAGSEFAPLGEFLVKEKIAVYAPNLRGQGLDPVFSRRGCELNVEQLLSDICSVVAEVRRRHPEAPVFFYGESMGGLLVMRLLNSNQDLFPIAGAILAVPVVGLAKPTPPIVQKIIHYVATYYPSLLISPKWFMDSKKSRLSHDPDKQRFLENAPYRLKKFTVSFIYNMGLLISSANHAAEQLHEPILVLGAGEDAFINTNQLLQWFNRVTSADKTLKIFPNSYHRLLYDQNQQEVEETILNWLKQRV